MLHFYFMRWRNEEEPGGAQDTPPTNMAPWHSERFRLKRNSSCRKDSGLPVKQVVDPHVTTVLPISGGKGDTVSIKTEGHGEESQ